MGGTASAGGGRATRARGLLLLLVLALAVMEYLFGSILDASPSRTYRYTPLYNGTQPKLAPDLLKTRKKSVEYVNSSAQKATPTSMLITKIQDGMKKGIEDVNKSDSAPVTLPICESMSDLGPVPANTTDMELDDVEKKFPEVQWGGRYTPRNCIAKHKVAIIVPYRDRQQHLPIFLNHMHPFLMKQQIEYGIYIVEQKGTKQFNRAKLMNVGFMESQKLEPGGFQCFIFHDIDLLPVDTRNLYSCTRQPRHMSASLNRHKFKLPVGYSTIFGGVSAMTLEQIHMVNGFSNKFWGWGGEDDDMYYRLVENNYHVARYNMPIARYTSLKHRKAIPNPDRFKLKSEKGKRFGRDGLSTLRYEIIQVMQYRLYTHILANIDWCIWYPVSGGNISTSSSVEHVK